MAKVLSVNYWIPGDDDCIQFNSDSLLSDADIILFKAFSEAGYQHKLEYWKNEILHELEHGKTIFILLTQFYSGIYNFLPPLPIEIISASGIDVFPKKNLVESFFVDFKDYWHVESYLKIKDTPDIILGSKKGDRILGATFKVKNGHIIFLPNLKFDMDALSYPNGSWTVYAESLGKSLKQHLNAIHNKLNLKENITEIPEWVNAYSLANEYAERQLLMDLIEEKRELENKIILQEKSLGYYDDLKKLLFSSGTDLEQIIKNVFIDIGYEIEEPEKNREDLIIKHKSDKAVIEIKGVNGSAAESHAAQLMKWVSGYYADNGYNPKGILIVNTFKNKSFKERNEDSFPDQMIRYCKKMELCLIKSSQLLELYLDFKDSQITFDELHNLIFSTIGLLEYNSKNKIQYIS